MKLGVPTSIMGIFLAALSGLEKIIFYLPFYREVGTNMTSLKASVPAYLWGITNFTFGGGVFLFFLGIVFMLIIGSKPNNSAS